MGREDIQIIPPGPYVCPFQRGAEPCDCPDCLRMSSLRIWGSTVTCEELAAAFDALARVEIPIGAKTTGE